MHFYSTLGSGSPKVNYFLPTHIVRFTIPEKKPGFPWTELYGAMVAAFSFLCAGIVKSYTSGAIYSLQTDVTSNISVTQSEISWIASAPPLAAFMGTVLSGPVMEYYGRKASVTMLALPYIIGWLIIGSALSFQMILIGRLLTGISLGMSKATAPVYVSETARAQHRGKLGYLPPIMSAGGILLGCHLSSVLPWKPLALMMTVFPVILFFASLALTESPHWLIKNHQEDLALRSLKQLRYRRGDLSEDVRIYREIQEIRDSVEEASQHETPGYWNLFERDIRYPVILIFLLMIFQEFSGATAIVYYIKMILNHGFAKQPSKSKLEAGAIPYPPSDHQDDMRPTIFGIVHFFAFFITLPLVDRLGRKFLLKISGVLMAMAHLILALYMQTFCNPDIEIFPNPAPSGAIPIQSDHDQTIPSSISFSTAQIHSSLPIVSLCIFIASYSLASAVPYILMCEMFGTSVRSYLCSASMLINTLAAFLVVHLFPTFMYKISPVFTFVLFAFFSILNSVIGYVIPETKGKTLAQVEAIFKGHSQSYIGKVKRNLELPNSSNNMYIHMSPPQNKQATMTHLRF